ncbi:hypothetical protein [Pseudobacteriovorax antillogorgiicola]|uniref:Uncharacterized protein n=1 Tax=Pseudobacteriovorax antillogorgiicola TaxID=1513793 RepID=A0A1Y6BTA5_9BACT|nr:hypothetical protein [Pseudobacteriovorax antillogorgiicola]TCS53926.1 hypothetical protein EDD56_107238 [Pseudobacteriovorax antillogorgiicola]SMF20504.1 hypothetical protein SAMN06296036_10734 [Pseudobacteriovorax antillogorgiicola]
MLRLALCALLTVSCSHTGSKDKSAKSEKLSSTDDFALASDKDLESDLFVEGQKYRFSEAFELPQKDEDEVAVRNEEQSVQTN